MWPFRKKVEQQPRPDIRWHIEKARTYVANGGKEPPAPQPAQETPAPRTPAPGTRFSFSGAGFEDEEIQLRSYITQARRKESFNESVLNSMREQKLTPKEFYTRAGFDRKLFSALKNGGPGYQPSRNTAIRCCFALQLTLYRAEELLKLAGYALSDRTTSDLLIRYCLENGIWDLFDVDTLMDAFGQEILFK